MLNDKLPQSAIRCLRGAKFEFEAAELSFERVFEVVIQEWSGMLLGPSLCRMLLDRHNNHTMSVDAFVKALKVCKQCSIGSHTFG
jgi:hypothetical protein